jgi:SAM-dependent methyltransferase
MMSADPSPHLRAVPDPAEDVDAAPSFDARDLDVKAKQAAYHDWEASTYDEKFSISYDQRCIDYARERFAKVVPEGAGFRSVLEVGAGTGFFLINLALGGSLGEAELHATDISEGMLDVCARNGASTASRSTPARATPRRSPTTTTPST